MVHRKHSSVALATAAALLFSTAPLATLAADTATIKCEGGNACKGQSECSTATNACAGQNSCKGQGYVKLTKSECAAAQATNSPADKKS